jgi:hypothetical protein
MIITVYRHSQAYTVPSEAVLRVASVSQFQAAWREGSGPVSWSGQMGFALGQPVFAQEPQGLLGPGRLGGIDLPEAGDAVPTPRHLVLLQSCNGDVRNAVWADGLDWQPGAPAPTLASGSSAA